MARWPGEGRLPGQGPGVRCPLYRWSSQPWPRWTKSWLAELQAEEEVEVEEARQGRDGATLELVMEAAGQLTHGQLEGLGVRTGQAHPMRWLGRAAHPRLWRFSHPW